MASIKSLIGFILLFIYSGSVLAVNVSSIQDAQVKEKLNNYLWEAARNGNDDQIKMLISGKYNLNVADERGYSAIILAAYHGHDSTVRLLIEAGANPCQRDKRGNSALMGAIFKGEIKVASRLIDAKCSPDIRNNAGQTAAMYASLFQRKELLQALVAKGANTQTVDHQGNSVSTLADGEIHVAH